jgi:lysozyme family protein
MIDLPVDTAMEIYAEDFWHPLSGDELLEISPIICEEIIDTGVNMGIGRAAEFLQKLLNVLNLQGQLYSDIAEDRDLGPQTLKALRTYLTARRRVDGERVLYRMLNSIQGAFYVDLAIRREKDEDFIYGWFKHRVQSWPTET